MRPKTSITGHPTVHVSTDAQVDMLNEIKSQGYSVHNATAQSVWAAAEACKSANIAFEVLLLQLADERVVGVVVRAQSYTGPVTTQAGVVAVIVESWTPMS